LNNTDKNKRSPFYRSFLKILLSYIQYPLIVLLLISVLFYFREIDSINEVYRNAGESSIQIYSDNTLKDFSSIISDLLVLSQMEELTRFLDNESQLLESEYRIYLKQKSIYSSIKLVDLQNNIVLSATLNQGLVVTSLEKGNPEPQLSKMYKRAFELKRDDIFITPVLLATRDNQVIRPFSPMIEFGTPVYGSDGRKKAILVLTYRAERILREFREARDANKGDLMLLGYDGYWIAGGEANRDFAGILLSDESLSFKSEFPDIWQEIKENVEGQIHTGDGQFTFHTTNPVPLLQKAGAGNLVNISRDQNNVNNYSWHVVHHFPADIFIFSSLRIIIELGIINLLFIAVFSVGSYFLARSRERLNIAREEAEKQSNKLTAMIQGMDEGIIFVDVAGKIVEANRYIIELLNLEKTIVGRQLASLNKSELTVDALRSLKQIKQGNKTGKVRVREVVFGEKVLIVRSQPIYRYKSFDGILLNIINVTELAQTRRMLELKNQELKEKNSELERTVVLAKKLAVESEAANIAKSEFLANMSHEIRTPLNAIMGFTELVIESPLEPDQKNQLELALESANSLLIIINDILDYSKIEAGKLDLEYIPFDIGSSIGNTLKTLAVKAHNKNLDLVFDIADDVPRMVKGDPGRLRQVIVNLVGNAIKFTNQGQVEVSISAIELNDDDCKLLFKVKDSGIGIAEEKQKDIFNAFSQADSSTRRLFGGTGLGLSISSQLIRMMGGDIWVKSKVGEGSTFYFTASFEAVEEKTSGSLLMDPAILADCNAVIVDDTRSNRQILSNMLHRLSIENESTDSFDEAFNLIQGAMKNEASGHFILLDANLNQHDGFKIAQKIKSAPETKDSIVIMMTSAGNRGDAAKCKELGIEAYVTKPIQQSELEEVLLNALNVNRMAVNSNETAPSQNLVTRHSIREGSKKINILLAEDNKLNQKLAVKLLENKGYLVSVVENGLQASEARKTSTDFDLILMDVQMPEMDGFEATKDIRTWEKDQGEREIPIIAMTAHAMKGYDKKCLAAGMNAYISKPINKQRLFEKIESFI
jgi:PAS domain S-box-containing protein